MQAYFDITKPCYLSTESGFDSYPIQVSAKAVRFAGLLNQLMETVKTAYDVGGAPEDMAQGLADIFDSGLEEILDERNYPADTPDSSTREQTPSVEVGDVLREEVH